MEDLKEKIVNWLKTKKESDIVFVKKNHIITIFAKHPGITEFDAKRLISQTQKIKTVERSSSHADRLLIIKSSSKNYDTTYIRLDPFNMDIEPEFKNKVAIITIYASRIKQ